MRVFKLLLVFIIIFLQTLGGFAQNFYLFIGTFTGPAGGDGIHVYRFDSKAGTLTKVSNTQKLVNPSYLTVSPDGKFVYSCTESRLPGSGNVSCFAFSKQTGVLTFVNKQPCGGDNPVYVAEHSSRKWLISGSYTGTSITVFPLANDGSILPAGQIIRYTDSTIVNQRDNKSHIHATVFAPDEKFVFVPDLGADKIRCFSFDALVTKPLQFASTPATYVVPGSGPRHFVFHPNKKFAYCAEELSGTVAAYTYTNGKLDSIQRILAHEAATPSPYASADIHISPDGRFLYVSNRAKENTIAIFKIDQKSGKLTSIGYESTYGEHPRNFMIDPTGRYLLVANEISNSVVVLKRDRKTGLLTKTNTTINIPGPSCLKMLAVN
ncbi:lactonase family protein [Xanthocytophaga agilis]|uniref:Lactonase family protein n=1 Tax=Xanthocytophaga agilis TaxID=3048010 RepID=A0AAE3UBF5_9BACT|nr:lactonase family protein [Xanthocytophaga agilis]MDJ1499005.1 lactonase family protein [Xanthocytophaga agilis]